MLLKSGLKYVSSRLGYEPMRREFGFVLYSRRASMPGVDPFKDIATWLRSVEAPVVLDVGANVGQTVTEVMKVLPSSQIHSFEPNPAVFATLSENVRRHSSVRASCSAVGDHEGSLSFHVNSASEMSSVLAPGPYCGTSTISTLEVPVTTIDRYVEANAIDHIDLLKSDTQGYELAVLRGAANTFSRNRVHLVFIEVIFNEMYDGMPAYPELFAFMTAAGFKLVSIYPNAHQDGMASWADALFVNPRFGRA